MNMSFKAEEPDSIIRHLNHYVKVRNASISRPTKYERRSKLLDNWNSTPLAVAMEFGINDWAPISLQTPSETISTNLKDDYEGIHRLCPGLFHDTVSNVTCVPYLSPYLISM